MEQSGLIVQDIRPVDRGRLEDHADDLLAVGGVQVELEGDLAAHRPPHQHDVAGAVAKGEADGCVDVAWDGVALTATPAAEVVRRVEVGAGSATVGVRLRPVAAGAVLGLPADELQAPTALREVWGDAAVRLEEQLAELPADTGLARLLDAVTCRARLRTPDARLAAAVDLLACAGSTVEGVAAAVGWSPRQLRRHCLAAVGLAPKSLQQVLRFRRALRALGERPLAAVAAEHGYADQAHLTRSMRRHAGATPRALLAAMHSTRVVAAR